MLKSDLRKRYKNLRLSLSKEDVFFLSEQIFKNFVLQFNVTENQNIHIFLSIEKWNEVQTEFFIEYFLNKGIHLYIPRVKNNIMETVPLTSETVFSEGSWGICEPLEEAVPEKSVHFDYILVPLLYSDSKGNRVGYGKGFYDNFFQQINPDALKVGLSYFLPEEKISDVSETDVPLDYLVTPTSVLSFGKTGLSKFRK